MELRRLRSRRCQSCRGWFADRVAPHATQRVRGAGVALRSLARLVTRTPTGLGYCPLVWKETVIGASGRTPQRDVVQANGARGERLVDVNLIRPWAGIEGAERHRAEPRMVGWIRRWCDRDQLRSAGDLEVPAWCRYGRGAFVVHLEQELRAVADRGGAIGDGLGAEAVRGSGSAGGLDERHPQ